MKESDEGQNLMMTHCKIEEYDLQKPNKYGVSLCGQLIAHGLNYEVEDYYKDPLNKIIIDLINSDKIKWHQAQFKYEEEPWNMTLLMQIVNLLWMKEKQGGSIVNELINKLEQANVCAETADEKAYIVYSASKFINVYDYRKNTKELISKILISSHIELSTAIVRQPYK